MTTATRQEVLGLYRRIFRLARKWQAASGQMEDTIKEKQYILNEARTLFQKNKNVSRPQLEIVRRRAVSCDVCSFPSENWEDWTAQVTVAECGARRAQRHSRASLLNYWEAEPSLGFSFHLLQVSVQPVSGSVSSEDPMSQVTQARPVRVFRGGAIHHTLPITSPSHRRWAVKLFFRFINYSRPPSINPFRGKRIGLRHRVPFITSLWTRASLASRVSFPFGTTELGKIVPPLASLMELPTQTPGSQRPSVRGLI